VGAASLPRNGVEELIADAAELRREVDSLAEKQAERH
jgi:hypothetical protein